MELSRDEKMATILIAAERNDVNKLMHAFLEDFDLDSRGYDGETPLHVAARYTISVLIIITGTFSHENFESVRFLVEKCLVNLQIKDRYGKTPLDHAEQSGYPEMVTYIAEQIKKRDHSSMQDLRDRRDTENDDETITIDE